MRSHRRYCWFGIMTVITTVAVLLTAVPGRIFAQEKATEEDIIKEKCTLCHAGHRVYLEGTDDIKALVERMQKKNPDWIKEVDSKHIVDSLTKLLATPEATAAREASAKAVAAGEKLFGDASLGTVGKSCADCHTLDSLRKVAQEYPRYDQGVKRMVSLQEKINMMINDNMKGEALTLGDEKSVNLDAFLKSLR